jgi:FAD synthase
LELKKSAREGGNLDIIHAEKVVDYDGTVVALGNFDGLHIAHMTIIRN